MQRSELGAPLIVLLGQTGSGKTDLALHLARRFNGEIISADSRAIYKGMDIGTAKPSAEERRQVPHHLIDVVTPDQSFTVADFQRLARKAIDDISGRGKAPFLVGGSGLYIDSVIYNFSFRRPANAKERDRLRALSVEKLQDLLRKKSIPLPENSRNPVHLIRAVETEGEAPKSELLRPRTLVIGLSLEKGELEKNIRLRVDRMIDAGFVVEVSRLSQRYGWEVPALQAPGYKAFRYYLSGQISLEQATQNFVRSDLQYAKRQRTWFRRNADIIWISKMEESVDLITTFLNK